MKIVYSVLTRTRIKKLAVLYKKVKRKNMYGKTHAKDASN